MRARVNQVRLQSARDLHVEVAPMLLIKFSFEDVRQLSGIELHKSETVVYPSGA
jgi:hypothetical protein